jgi:hypothetical protein
MDDNQFMPVLVPVSLSGLYSGTVMTTPNQVRTAKAPSFFTPQAKVKVNLDINSSSIHSNLWKNSAGIIKLSVYEGGLHFSGKCPNCLEPVTKTELTEVAVVRRQLGKVEFNSRTVPVDRINTALTSDRFWYQIPFCNNCGLKKHAIGFSGQHEKKGSNYCIVLMKNREYAKEFNLLNHGENGRWLAPKHIFLRALGAVATVLFLGALVGFAAAWSSGTTVITISLPFIILLAIGAAASLAAWIIGSRGEAL